MTGNNAYLYIKEKRVRWQEKRTEKDMGVQAIFSRGGGAVTYFSKSVWVA